MWQNVGSNFCPYDRSGPHRDKNTWICFTISVFVPGRKGYFCLVFAGLRRKGTLLHSQAVSKWQVWKPNTCWEVPRRPSRHLRWQSKVQIWTHPHLVLWPWDPMIVTSEAQAGWWGVGFQDHLGMTALPITHRNSSLGELHLRNYLLNWISDNGSPCLALGILIPLQDPSGLICRGSGMVLPMPRQASDLWRSEKTVNKHFIIWKHEQGHASLRMLLIIFTHLLL